MPTVVNIYNVLILKITFSVFRFIEMHRGHAEGTFYQYINKHINDDFQVISKLKGLDM